MGRKETCSGGCILCHFVCLYRPWDSPDVLHRLESVFIGLSAHTATTWFPVSHWTRLRQRAGAGSLQEQQQNLKMSV